MPLSSRPYQLGVTYRADFVELIAHLKSGDMSAVSRYYRGTLLESSDAPGVREHRTYLEEAVRRAALAGRDPNLLFELGTRLEDDLEVWETVLRSMAVADTRRPLVEAWIKHTHETWTA